MTETAAAADRPRIAVTVIGGYLGAGKTTLVNHLLREADERIAVLVNDFGEINIDLDLIEARTDDTIELSNGCICCSMVDGFSEALDRIAELDPPPARLVVEASGVADPAGVAAYGHGPGLELDAVVVLVDAETVREAADDRYLGQTVRQQLAAAEVLVVNKADLVEPTELESVVEWMRTGWPDAFVVTTTESRVDPLVLFGRPSLRSPAGPDEHHHPEQLFESRVENLSEPMTRDQVESWMASLPPTVVRAKGFVQLAEDPDRPHVLQRVGRRWSLRSHTAPWAADPETRIVLIERR